MSLLVPDLYYCSVADIDLDELQRRGVRVLLLDLDNTLVLRNTTEASERVRSWVRAAKQRGMLVTIVSNNWHERVQQAADDLDVAIVGKATKPLPSGFRRALRGTDAAPSECAVVGDQVFTDILGGSLFGSTTVLVTPLAGGSDLPHTRLLRTLERRILRGRKPQRAPRGDSSGE